MLWKIYDWYDDVHNLIFKFVLKLLWWAVALVPLWLAVTKAQAFSGWLEKGALYFIGLAVCLMVLTSRPYYWRRATPRRRLYLSMGDFLQRWGLTLGAFLFAGIPAWFFLGVRSVANPEGFWQNIVLYGVGLYFLGAFQLVFAIAFCAFTVSIWEDGRW